MMEPGPQFKQLAMFHPASDFVGDRETMPRIYPNDVDTYTPDRGHSSFGTMWEAKERESHKVNPATGRSLIQSIAQRTDERPVEVWHHDDIDRSPFDTSGRDYQQPSLADGHHRAIAHYVSRGPESLVPVEHIDDQNQGWGWAEPSPKMLHGYRAVRR